MSLTKAGGGAGGAGAPADVVALRAENERLRQEAGKKDKVIEGYTAVLTEVAGHAAAASGNGAERLRATVLSYKREKEQVTLHLNDLKARRYLAPI